MTHRVNLPNGEALEFPDNMTDDQIDKLLTARFSGGQSSSGNIHQQINNDPNLQTSGDALADTANSPGINAILGAGDSLRNLLSLGKLSNSPTSNFGTTEGSQSGSGASYTGGKLAGDIAGFLGGGEVLDAARAGIEGAPLVGKLAELLGQQGIPGMAKRVIGSSAYGAATNPEDRLNGVKQGAIGGAIGEALPLLVNPIKSAAEYMMPEKFAKNVASTLKNSFNDLKDQFKQKYAPTIDKFGNYKIGLKNKSYSNIGDDITDRYYSGASKAHEEYVKNPTVRNAHKLQSQLGYDQRVLENKPVGKISPEENATLKKLKVARNSIKSDIDDFFRMRSNDLADSYKNTTKEYMEQVVPFKENAAISNMASGKVKKPTSKQVMNAFKESEHPMFKELSRQMERRLLARKAGQIGGSALAGATLGSPFGIPIALMTGLAGAGAGTAAVPAIMEHFPGSISPEILDSISKMIGKGYGAVKKSALATKLTGT